MIGPAETPFDQIDARILTGRAADAKGRLLLKGGA